jgi:hypothetical protein
MTRPVAAVQEHWSTFCALVAASARATARQLRLVLFPLLAILSVATTFYAIASSRWLPMWRPPLTMVNLLRWWRPLSALLGWYLLNVVLVFWSVALTHAALAALRQQPVSFGATVRVALRRLPAILGFAAVAATLGVVASSLERRSHWVVRASMAVFGQSWTLISLFALTAMAGERLGPLDSLRRGRVLLRATWAEKRLTTLGMGLLWVPLLALESAGVGLAQTWQPGLTPAAIWLCLSVNILGWATFWLLERVYVAAVYCYAVEGVVPASFETEELYGSWLARPSPLPAGSPAPPVPDSAPAPDFLGWLRRQENGPTPTGALLATLAATVAAVAYVGSRPGLVKGLDPVTPAESLIVGDVTFPGSPRLYATRELRGGGNTLGITAGPAPWGASVFVLQEEGMKALGRQLRPIDYRPLEIPLRFFNEIAAFEPSPGTLVFVGDAEGRADDAEVVALSGKGELLFRQAVYPEPRTFEERPHAHAVDAVAPIRTPAGWGVAVGYNGSHGLCFLDERGSETWCKKDLGNVWFVTALDCDGDGWEDILSLSPGGRPEPAACYKTDGTLMGQLELPDVWALRAVDLDDDGKKELTYVANEKDSVRLGAIRADGKPLVEMRVACGPKRCAFRVAPMAVRRSRQGPKDIVGLGPDGELLGISLSGQRWKAGRDYSHLTVIDLDDDGLDEVIGLEWPRQKQHNSRNVTAWTWRSDGGQ